MTIWLASDVGRSPPHRACIHWIAAPRPKFLELSDKSDSMAAVAQGGAEIAVQEELISPSAIHFPASREKQGRDRRQCLIFFVPGNPGLCQYYKLFLLRLRDLLRPTEEKAAVSFHFHCRNLLGFSEDDHKPFGKNGSEPFMVSDQIEHFEQYLEQLRTTGWASGEGQDAKGLRFDDIILMGHSVGSYIAIELFHRHMHSRASSTSFPSGAVIKAGIMLFPTITHIARSPSGRKLELIRKTPFLNKNASSIATGFVHLLPIWLLYQIVHLLLRFPAEPARVTTDWLASRDGIRQAIEMGKDEMATIGEERWSEELWEISEDADADAAGTEQAGREVWAVPKFCFFFGDKDHWVADDMREEFIRKRETPERKKAQTRIVIDETGIPHAFCIHHSEQVAEKAALWINEIMRPSIP